ncbi:hypothetical protein BGZ93_010191 [Podila epicladia]|nr:hypothetical protein BGZ93_010191 [Podila epicladia]
MPSNLFPPAVRELATLTLGIDFDADRPIKMTALQYSVVCYSLALATGAAEEFFSIVQTLLKAIRKEDLTYDCFGSNSNVVHLAAFLELHNIIELLILHGADASHLNGQGLSPCDIMDAVKAAKTAFPSSTSEDSSDTASVMLESKALDYFGFQGNEDQGSSEDDVEDDNLTAVNRSWDLSDYTPKLDLDTDENYSTTTFESPARSDSTCTTVHWEDVKEIIVFRRHLHESTESESDEEAEEEEIAAFQRTSVYQEHGLDPANLLDECASPYDAVCPMTPFKANGFSVVEDKEEDRPFNSLSSGNSGFLQANASTNDLQSQYIYSASELAATPDYSTSKVVVGYSRTKINQSCIGMAVSARIKYYLQYHTGPPNVYYCSEESSSAELAKITICECASDAGEAIEEIPRGTVFVTKREGSNRIPFHHSSAGAWI